MYNTIISITHSANIMLIFNSLDTYERGMEKLSLAQDMSEVETETDDGRKRRRLQKRRIISPVTSDEDVDDRTNLQLPVLPTPPQCFSQQKTNKYLLPKSSHTTQVISNPEEDSLRVSSPFLNATVNEKLVDKGMILFTLILANVF